MVSPIKQSFFISCLLVCVPFSLHAGAYFFASEGAINETLIVHPSNYTGSESTVTVRVCIDPASEDSSGLPNATDMEIAVQNNINIFNQFQPTLGNVKLGGNNNLASNEIDFESVALHEIGHCLGLAHINAASESGQTGNNQNYTKATDGADDVLNLDNGTDGVIGSADDLRGDDGNLVWFRKSNNDPFTIDSVIDSSTYSRKLADLPVGDNFAANADRSVSTLLGYVQTEAIMQQGSFFDEEQRTLGHDDVATIAYAESGLDEQAGTSDDYAVVLEYAGISTTNCDVSLKMTAMAGLAFCGAGGELIGNGPGPNGVDNHVRLLNTVIEFGNPFNWFFNTETVNKAPVLVAVGDQTLVEQDSVQISINASDADGDNLTIVANNLPAFSNLVDNGDGTAILTISPVLGEAGVTQVTITVNDDGLPILNVEETIQLNVLALDTDGDGLSDFDEINTYGTLVNNPDTDGDFISDGDEINNATGSSSNPLDPLSFPNFADGDIAPLGSPDGLINAADYLVAQRIVLGELIATSLELAHADVYPVGSPDGVINASDLILILQLVQ